MGSHKSHLESQQQQLIGNARHKQFLELQATYGIAQRGGVQLPVLSNTHNARLVSDINLLDPVEKRRLILCETIISN